MTTREEYAEAAEWFDFNASETRNNVEHFNGPDRKSFESLAVHQELAARVLRQLAEGAVLCKKHTDIRHTDERAIVTYTYIPIEEQPTAATETALWSRDPHEQ
jgi:hypothetical protein